MLQGFLSPGWRGGARGGGGGEGRTPEEDHLRQAEKPVFSDLHFFVRIRDVGSFLRLFYASIKFGSRIILNWYRTVLLFYRTGNPVTVILCYIAMSSISP